MGESVYYALSRRFFKLSKYDLKLVSLIIKFIPYFRHLMLLAWFLFYFILFYFILFILFRFFLFNTFISIFLFYLILSHFILFYFILHHFILRRRLWLLWWFRWNRIPRILKFNVQRTFLREHSRNIESLCQYLWNWSTINQTTCSCFS